MSFRLADLKKSVRKSWEGYRVTVGRLEGRWPLFRIEFVLQQMDDHLGQPRRCLDPAALVDFLGDTRLGRGVIASLAQWYRVRPLRFSEISGGRGNDRLTSQGITGPVDLRAWLFGAANCEGGGFLDPVASDLFWARQARRLGVDQKMLSRMMILDRPEEAILARTGPRPAAADVMAAYNARAHTTLLRCAAQITLHSQAPRSVLERAARTWAGGLGVEYGIDGASITLKGRADALGCWTRHGRRVEQCALELMALPDLEVSELAGRVNIRERECGFRWQRETLVNRGVGRGSPLTLDCPQRIEMMAARLRRERDQQEQNSGWLIRRSTFILAADGGAWLPHLELRRGDQSVYIRLSDSNRASADPPAALTPFIGKTPIVLMGVTADDGPATLQSPGAPPAICQGDRLLDALGERLNAASAPVFTRELQPAA